LLFTQPDTLKVFAAPSSLSLGQPTSVAGVPVVTVISKRQEEKNSTTVTYHIGKNDHLLRQMTLKQTQEGQTITLTETHTNIKINTKFPASTFVFTPPPGAKPVKAFAAPK
jgi:outer membrane lipoprotein-sorting protein